MAGDLCGGIGARLVGRCCVEGVLGEAGRFRDGVEAWVCRGGYIERVGGLAAGLAVWVGLGWPVRRARQVRHAWPLLVRWWWLSMMGVSCSEVGGDLLEDGRWGVRLFSSIGKSLQGKGK